MILHPERRPTIGTLLTKNEPGNDCGICFGPGKTFGDVVTPYVIQLRLTRLLPGEHEGEVDFDDLLRTRYLEQTNWPCVFSLIDGTVSWQVDWSPVNTSIVVGNIITMRTVFVALGGPLCSVDLPNDNIAPAGKIAYGGFANVTWDLEGLE